MNTHETYVSLEVAKLLKQAGFDWDCLMRYWSDTGKTEWFGNSMIVNPYGNDTIPCPTLAVVQRWLKEEKGWIVESAWHSKKSNYGIVEEECYTCHLFYPVTFQREGIEMYDVHVETDKIHYPTYESALEAGIKKCLTLILEEKI